MDHKNNCFICGNELACLEKDEDMQCFYCKEPYTSNENIIR